MKYDFFDRKTLKIYIEKDKDLITVYKIINPGDIIEGYDYRVIEINNQKERKKVWIRILVEDIYFSEYSDNLRISGKILEASEEVQGHYHTFDLKVGSEVIIKKQKPFKYYDIKELEKSKSKKSFYIVSVDNNSISVGKINDKLEIIYDRDFHISKEDPERESILKKIYSEAINTIKEDSNIILVVGPVFYPEKFSEYLKEKMPNKKIYSFKISIGGIAGIYEFLNRKEYLDFLKDLEIIEINKIIDDFLFSITKDKVSFGLDEVYNKVLECNVEYVLVSFEWFRKIKSDKKDFEKFLDLIDKLEVCRAEIYFVYKYNKNFDLIDKFGIVCKVRY
ncbi:MAG: hypothetical protein QXN76_00355 [Nanopusillaceae archaeon]